MLSYAKFLLKSTNQYGVHSPFVFDYLTQCIYKKPKRSKDKTTDLLLKSIDYFKLSSIKIKNEELKRVIINHFGHVHSNTRPFDLYLVENPDDLNTTDKVGKIDIHNNSMIMLNNIHKNNEMGTIWQDLIQNKQIHVTIDFYHCGVAFLRKEQVKQHFTIRI